MNLQIFGFPIMSISKPYQRDYPPWLIQWLSSKKNVSIYLEEGYGSDLGFKKEEYQAPNIHFKTRKEVFTESDYVVCMTAPTIDEIKMMHEGQVLLAFLHYNTHPTRNKLFVERGVQTISLDDVKGYRGRRLVEDLQATSYNAVKAAIKQLRKELGEELWFDLTRRKAFQAFIMGTGSTAQLAVRALNHLGYLDYQEELKEKGGNPKILVTAIGRYETSDKDFMNKHVLPRADIFVDATFRPAGKNHHHIISGDQLELLPPHAVICDITADKYDTSSQPHVVKAIQGIPTGMGTDYGDPTFPKDHRAFTDPNYVPPPYQLKPEQRRAVVSSYSWPSYGTREDRLENVEHYANQVKPLLDWLADHGTESIVPPAKGKTNYWNDAIYRALNPLFSN